MAWRYFCFPEQKIKVSGNNKDQTTFTVYDIILDSPTLLNLVGKDNVQARHIRLLDGDGNVKSFIQTATMFTGILSNITGFTFKEFFQLKELEFLTIFTAP